MAHIRADWLEQARIEIKEEMRSIEYSPVVDIDVVDWVIDKLKKERAECYAQGILEEKQIHAEEKERTLIRAIQIVDECTDMTGIHKGWCLGQRAINKLQEFRSGGK